ncbi:MAG: hypothetical protein J6S67_10540, partial [Methanobrevibacter sp.]|nr:hypothetical protein [Methanobrevibacter sp.]
PCFPPLITPFSPLVKLCNCTPKSPRRNLRGLNGRGKMDVNGCFWFISGGNNQKTNMGEL